MERIYGFFSPIDRRLLENHQSDQMSFLRLQDFCDRFFSFGPVKKNLQIDHANTTDTHRAYTILNENLRVPYWYLTAFIKVITVATLVRKFPKLIGPLLVTAVFFKYRIRSTETLGPPPAPLPDPLHEPLPLVPPQPTPEPTVSQDVTTIKVQKEQCYIYSNLFMIGVTPDQLNDYLDKATEPGVMVEVNIGEESREYDRKFLERCAFFLGILCCDMGEEENRVDLHDGFPVSHDQLQQIQKGLWEQSCSTPDEQLVEAMDFLGIDKEPDWKQRTIRAIRELQSTLSSGELQEGEDSPHLNAGGHGASPSVKVGTPFYNSELMKDIRCELSTPGRNPEQDVILDDVERCVANINHHCSNAPWKQHYYINKLIHDVVSQSLARPDNLIPLLNEILERHPSIEKYVTILVLPDSADHTDLPTFLSKTNLLWLQVGSDMKNFDVTTLPDCPKVFVLQTGPIGDEEEERLKAKMPNLITHEILQS